MKYRHAPISFQTRASSLPNGANYTPLGQGRQLRANVSGVALLLTFNALCRNRMQKSMVTTLDPMAAVTARIIDASKVVLSHSFFQIVIGIL